MGQALPPQANVAQAAPPQAQVAQAAPPQAQVPQAPLPQAQLAQAPPPQAQVAQALAQQVQEPLLGPVAAAHPLVAAHVDQNGAKCSVCLDRFINARLRCDHVYCVPCLQTLKDLKRPCPNCRKGFRKWKPLFGGV